MISDNSQMKASYHVIIMHIMQSVQPSRPLCSNEVWIPVICQETTTFQMESLGGIYLLNRGFMFIWLLKLSWN